MYGSVSSHPQEINLLHANGIAEMNRFRCLLLVLFSSMFISACATLSPVSSQRPAWIDNPGNGVSASAGMHVRGRVAQEQLAIQRAREEFAKRFGVSISSVQTFTTIVANGRSNTVLAQVGHEEIQKTEVKAVVKAKWLETGSEVLWVWLVPSD